MVILSPSRFQRLIGRGLRAARQNPWLGAVSLVALYLASVSHVALVPHVLCEDGEMTHARRVDPASLADRVLDSPLPAIASATQKARLASSDGHHHCLVCVNRRNQLSQGRAPLEPCSTVTDLRKPSSSVLAPARAVVLQFAPKHSPPA